MILFVDDEERWIRVFMEELRRFGYDVHLETSVDRALGFFRANSDEIQLVVLDIMIPMATRSVPRKPRTAAAPVCMYTRDFGNESRICL